MNSFWHRVVAGAVAVVLLLGCGLACAQPLSAKSQHSCCDPKGSCKSKPSEMKSAPCDRNIADVPQSGTLDAALDESPLPHIGAEIISPDSTLVFLHSASPQRLTPLRI